MRKRFIIAVDLGGTNLKVALLDSACRILHKNSLNTKKFTDKPGLIRAIVSSIKKILECRRIKKSEVLGVGLGLPGPIDVKRGIVHFFPNIPGWREVSLRGILKNKLKLPVFLDNDANLMALAESRSGAAKGSRHAVCLTLGTGVGGGLIIDGRLDRGGNFAAAEIGHIPINEKGPRCNCGGLACLESYVGNSRILKRAARLFGRRISMEELDALAAKGNRKALAIWSEVGKRLGIALSGVVNLLNPDCIVIGGGVANAGKALFSKIRSTIDDRGMSVQARHVKVYKARLGADAGLIGAALLVKDGKDA
ncbi:ROK family protein [Candidatus Omnitrophota bacterium]